MRNRGWKEKEERNKSNYEILHPIYVHFQTLLPDNLWR